MSSLETDLNTPPYFDDFDETKNYHRVLFRPSVAVQARELTQLQTIGQNQTERFADTMFKDGSIVDGVPITYYPKVHYISLEDTFNVNASASPTSYDSTYLVTNSQTSANAVRGVIKLAKNGIKDSAPETNRFYLNYIYTGTDGSNNDVAEFSPGDTLYIYSPDQSKFGTLDANNLVNSVNTLASNGTFNSDGYTFCAAIGDGTIYQKGFFTRVEPQFITVNDFSTNTDGYVIGFNTVESIIDENDDTSLLDNALGYDNENAPGAHRLKLTPTLVAKLKTDVANNTNFFSIAEFNSNSRPVEQEDDPSLNILEKSIAQRTYEESGDYAIKPFKVESRVKTANTTHFHYEVSSGVAMVRGKRIERIGSFKLSASKADTVEYAQNQFITANYGNYVICDELAGIFDYENLQEVSLYDTAQNSVSEYEGSTSAVSGSEVGKANIRAVVYYNGTKGNSSAQYLIYLFNIRMNSGKSFTDDVKSIYVDGTYGKAKADIVLELNKAVLKESNNTKLYFDSGLTAVKSLTNNSAVNDTFYPYNQLKTSTINSAGEITITIDAAGPGASNERVYSSTENDYVVQVSANAYTANLSGTVAFTSGNSTIAGSGTTFTTNFSVGDNIRIYSNTSTAVIRQVTAIANDTIMSVNAPITVTNAAANYAKYYVTGSTLPVDNVTINTNTNFTIDTGLTLDSGSQTVYCSYPVLRNQAAAIPKQINKSRFVKIDCSNNVATSVGPWDLGFVDGHKVRNIYVGSTYSNTNPERSSWFIFDNGQTDNQYGHSRIFVKPQYASNITSGTKMLVEMDFFTANTSASVGFFSVESYPIDDANTANTSAIQTIEIPYYKGQDLRNIIDFRPRKFNTANTAATTEAAATINPAVANGSFNVPASGNYLITPDENFIADFEYYLPRYDLITIDSAANFTVVEGTPSETPKVPFVENDQSVLAESYVPPYPSATVREAEAYNFSIPYIKTSIKTNRRYTMKDIGKIEERLKRLEYYTVLNALEASAKQLTIPDANGLDRFKNGIFADSFNSHKIGNVSDIEYKIAIDPKLSIARPFFTKHDVDYQYNSSSSSNTQRTGPLVTLAYDSEKYIEQKYATKVRNATENFWKWSGTIDLYPNFDYFRNEDRAPNITVDLDLTSPWEQFANSPFGTNWGQWETVSSTQRTAENTVEGSGTTFTTTTTDLQQQIGNQIIIDSLNQDIDLGSYVSDISIQPYMRSRLVAFVAYNMKPNTTLYPFFDDVNVSQYCAPGEISGVTEALEGREDRVVNRTGNFGDPLVSDSKGFICGVFNIPESTFRIGERVFQLTNVDDLVTGASARITSSKAAYTADNISVTKTSTTINAIQPQISTRELVNDRTLTTTTSIFVPDPPPPPPPAPSPAPTPPPPPPINWPDDDNDNNRDPIAQSFTIKNLPNSVSGTFINKIGVYFKNKDESLGCSVFICEMENGYPNSNKIIGKAHLNPEDISVSSDGTTETVFTLYYPAYLLSNNEYAFFVQPDGNSPNYEVWVGETGGFDVATDEQVFSNPYSGVMFVSSNRVTWTTIQTEDVKFNIYRCKFTSSSGYAVFENEDDEALVVDGFTRANTSVGISVGDIVYTVNSAANTSNVASIVSNTLTSAVNGRVQYINEAEGSIWLDSSTANSTSFFSNTTNPTIAIYRTSDPANTSLVNANTLISYATIQEVKNLTYHSVVPKFSTLTPTKSFISIQHKGTSTTNVKDTSYVDVEMSKAYEYKDRERHAMSKSNELNSLSGAKSSEFKINFGTTSDYVSPVINLNQKSSLYVENLINNSSNNEHTRYGEAATKYVSKKLVLKDGQEAEDLKVYLTAYRPFETDIKVYAKFWNNQDPELFEDKVWTELQYDNDGEFVYSSTASEEYREYEFSVPTVNAYAQQAFSNVSSNTINSLTGTISIANNSYVIQGSGTSFNTELTVGDTIRIVSDNYFAIRTVENIANATYMTVNLGLQASNNASLYYVFDTESGNDGIVEYKNSADSRFIGYKEVAFKVVLLSSNPVNVPKLKDIRAVCLQV